MAAQKKAQTPGSRGGSRWRRTKASGTSEGTPGNGTAATNGTSGRNGTGTAKRRPRSGAAAAASSARKALVALAAVIAILAGLLVYGVTTDRTGWAPKLALDLEGGTQMVLSPTLQGENSGQDISQEQLDQAVEIIRQRVDGAGVSEAEITTQSGRNIVVSMPGVPRPRHVS